MTSLRSISVALVAALAPLSAGAAVCAVDTVPAASLLVPYFELDLATACSSQLRNNASETEFWFHNTSNESTLSRVTLWSQAGIPALDFLVYQQGRESHHIPLRSVLCDGTLPRTGPGEGDTSRFSLLGTPSLSLCFNGSFGNQAPMYPPLTSTQLADLRLALTGKVVPSANGCYAPDAGDQVARGYITIDVVRTCAAVTPADTGYYDTSTGEVPIASDNVLVGGFLLSEGAQNIGYGAAAIALEAAPAGRFVQDDSTFYGRYHGYSGVDRREPLPSTWMTGLAHSGANGSNGEAIVWREVPKLTPSMALCAGSSTGGEVPLEAREQRLFDAGGHSQPAPQAPPAAIPLATQRLPLSALESTSVVGSAGRRALGYAHLADGTADPRLGQAWFGALVRTEGRYGDLVSGIPIDSRCDAGSSTPADVRGPTPTNPNVPGYFWADGFED
jgi:hypothetical protein